MKQLTWNKIFILTLFSSTIFANKINCKESFVTTVIRTEKITVPKEVCFLVEKNKEYYISKKCNKKCSALQDQKIFVSPKRLHSTSGTPNFKLCSAYKGHPEIVVLNEGRPNEKMTDKCTFKDGSFVTTTYLMDQYSKIMF